MAKVERDAFIYLEPKPRDDESSFAQCGSCRMFVPKVMGLTGSRCIIHGSKQKIDVGDSCGFYVDWPMGKPNPKVQQDHAAELEKDIPGSVKASESGLVDNRVQCHRCTFALDGATLCGLYLQLTRKAPNFVSLDDKIEPHACCNAWTEKTADADDQTEWFENRARDVMARRIA